MSKILNLAKLKKICLLGQLLAVSIIAATIMLSSPAKAADIPGAYVDPCADVSCSSGFTCRSGSCIPLSATGLNQQVSLKDQFAFGKFNSLGEILSGLIGPAFSIAAVAVVFYFLIGAFKYLTSGGDKNAVASARDMITHSIIGFLLLMMLFLIMQFIPQIFGFKIAIF